MKAKLNDLSFALDGSARLTLQTEEDPRELFERLKDLPVRVEIKQWREKRSLDANAYYWCLLGKCAAALKISNPRAHNLMLRRYGVPERIDEQLVYLVLPESEEAEEKALESENYHIKPTAQVKVGKDGKAYRTYIMLRGSSSYDSQEMNVLINGLVEECRALGIETRSPEEIASMLEGCDVRQLRAV